MRRILPFLIVVCVSGCDDSLPPVDVQRDTGPDPDQRIEDVGAAEGGGGCTSNKACSDGRYCRFDGCEAEGVCEDRPEICPQDCPGVCGCDGRHYCNECDAAAAGVSIGELSACAVPPPPPPPPSGCLANECGPLEFCDLSGCGRNGARGKCEERPSGCSMLHAPVCGCDGISYPNECEAHKAGSNVDYPGDCKCATDADCPVGQQWCDKGFCTPCDNGGQLCDLACPAGWDFYERNGCTPCACAPPNECWKDYDCGNGQSCYAGAFCWDWCPPGDPSCCYGNICSATGCTTPPPVGCRVRGCPADKQCDFTTCGPSNCNCASNLSWICTKDCLSGGACK